MDPTTTQARIQELESVRRQINLWRLGVSGVILVTVVACVGLLYSDARALATQGPKQQVFVDDLQAGMNENVVPRLREVASRTLTEMQPVVQKEFLALNTRVPDVTRSAIAQITELQRSLPERAGKTLDASFDKAFHDKEAEVRKMFPDATEDQVRTLFTNLSAMTQTRSQAVAQELLTPHVQELNAIQGNLDRIAATERARPGERTDDWGMGLAVFDVVRDDLKDITLPKGQAAGMIVDAAGRVSQTAKDVAATADGIAAKAKQEGGK